MGNITFAVPSVTSKVVAASGGSWMANYPLSETVQVPIELGFPARSVDADPANTQGLFILDDLRPISIVSLVNHNISNSATWRVRFYDDFTGSNEIFDTGVLEAVTLIKPWGTAQWGTPEWWDGKPGPDTRRSLVLSSTIALNQFQLAGSFRVEINDPNNSDGYVQWAHTEAAGRWTSPKNFDFGASLGFRNRSLESEADGGAIYTEKRRNPRVFRGVIQNLPTADAFGQALNMQRQLGTSDPMLVQLNPDDEVNLQTLTMMARLRALPGIDYAFPGKFDFPVQLEEVL